MARLFEIRENATPSIPGMMLATINALKMIGGSGKIEEIVEKVIENEKIPEEEQSLLIRENGPPRLNYYLSWARTYLKRGGALVNSSRGVWALTEAGWKIENLEDVKRIYEQVNKEERERQKLQRKHTNNKDTKNEYEFIENGDEHSRKEEDWKQKLLNRLSTIPPEAFERLAQRLLREAGFIKVQVLGKSRDGGIDGVGILRVGLVSFHVYFQCKRWKNGSIGSKEIRDFRGALQERGDKGLFITTGTFTSDAKQEAERDGAIAIDLIDGDRLCDLLKEYGLGVKSRMVEEIDIDESWFDSI